MNLWGIVLGGGYSVIQDTGPFVASAARLEAAGALHLADSSNYQVAGRVVETTLQGEQWLTCCIKTKDTSFEALFKSRLQSPVHVFTMRSRSIARGESRMQDWSRFPSRDGGPA